MKNKQKRYWLAASLFIFCAFCFYMAWAASQPYNAAPDESMRYQISQFIYHKGTLPSGGDPVIRNPIWGISYGFTPILPQIIGAVFMKITSLFTKDAFALLMSVRFVSVLCNTGTVFMCFKIAEKLFSELYRWIFVISIAMLPQFIYIGSYVNNDALAIFSTAIIVYSWIIGLASHWSRSSCISLSLGLSLCALTYYNAFGFILCSILLYAADRLITYRSSGKLELRREFRLDTGRQAGLIIALVFLLAGWWYIRNAIIYDGDFLGLRTSNHYAQLYAKDKYKPTNIYCGYNQYWTLLYMLIDQRWLQTSFESMIGIFGYFQLGLKSVIYYIYLVLWGGSAVGVVSWVLNGLTVRTVKLDKTKLLLPAVMLMAIPIPIILSIYYSYYSDFEPQGRYLLPMLIPLMFFITRGYQQIIEKLLTSVWIRRGVQILLCLWSVVVAFYSYFKIILPHYVH